MVMTDVDNVHALIPPAKSWENPPRLVTHGQNFTGGIYEKSERAFQTICLNRNEMALNMTLHSFLEVPILNPCFLNRKQCTHRKLTLENRRTDSSKWCYLLNLALRKNVYKTQYLVVWS